MVTMRVAFWGNFGTHNLGNECTLHAMLFNARRYLPDAELIGVGNDPHDTEQRHSVTAMRLSSDMTLGFKTTVSIGKVERVTGELRDWFRVIRTMRRVDMLVMTGTGLLTDTHDGTFGMPYQMLKWVTAAALWRRPVAFVSVGAEGLRDPLKLRMLSLSLRWARYRSYRDPISRQRAATLYAKAARDPVYPDLAFSLPEELSAARDHESGQTKQTVAVGLYAVESGANALRDYIEQTGRFVLWLLDHGYRVRIVLGDIEYDTVVRNDLMTWLARHDARDRVLDDPIASFQELMLQLAEVDLVVATRFHNVLLSIILGKPVVSVSHMDKNDSLMASLGLQEYCMSLENVQCEAVVAKFEALAANQTQVRRQILEQLGPCRERLEEQYRRLFSDLIGGEASRG